MQIISALTLSPSKIGSVRTKSPRFIQTFLRNFVGIETRNVCPSASSTSCKLFPLPPRTLNIKKMNYYIVIESFETLNTLTIDCFSSGKTYSSNTCFVTCFRFVAFDILLPWISRIGGTGIFL
jgi:hypothetical protein